MLRNLYPMAAVVGQEQVKKALMIALVNPRAGGLLIGGRKGTAKSVLARSCRELLGERRMVELPLNITEDMLFGSIDLEYAVSRGEKRFAPGILARAHGNILYVDEVNLLRPELLTAVLDANAAGVNNVERDGISFSHPVQLTLIATMNPEEGVLPGHLLDRFGMYVDVQGEMELPRRVEIMRRALKYAADADAFRQEFAAATAELAEQIKNAAELLPRIELSEAMLRLAAQMSAQAFCAGHRADICLLEVARALAALSGRSFVLPGDVEEAALFVLPHRTRRPQEEQLQEEEQEEDSDTPQNDEENNDADADEEMPPPPPQEEHDETLGDNAGEDDEPQEGDNERKEQGKRPAPEEQLAPVDKNFPLLRLALAWGKDRKLRRGSGKRSTTKTDLKQGRYVRAELPQNKVEDLAFDATIRAAAPFQKMRPRHGCALTIREEDLRQKVREKRIGSTFLFAVDASGSMGARERMRAVKGAVFQMLQEAYQKRDRVGMLAFRRRKAEMLLPITRSVDLAQKCLAELPTGGATPLADGLSLALTTLALLTKRERDMEPILVLVTDGRANAAENGGNPVESALSMAEKLRRAKITSLVIDTESGFIKLGLAKRIAVAMGASYYTLQRLSEENIINIVRNLEG